MSIVNSLEPLIPALRRYARALLHNRWDADDLVQDCLERAISRWHQRRSHEDGKDGDGTDNDQANSTRAWVFAILHNLAMTRLRRAARHPHVPLDESDDAAHVTAYAHAQERSQQNPQENHLHCQNVLTALARLPDEQRTLLLLIAVEDLTYAEAARVLDIPIGTVMSRLSRARERLHRMLSNTAAPDAASRAAAPNPRATLRTMP